MRGLILGLVLGGFVACANEDGIGDAVEEPDADTDTDVDADADTDSDSDTDVDTDSDTDTDADTDTEPTTTGDTGMPALPCPQGTANAVPFTATGDLALSPDAHQASCAFGGGNDYSVEFTAPEDGNYVFSVGNSDPTDVVVSLEDQCRGIEIACDATFRDALVSQVLVADQTVLVVVEGFSALGNGPFQLDIREADFTETSCTDGFDNDGDGSTDCADSECYGLGLCGAEVCDDNFDNDGNGDLDCLDGACVTDPSCCPLETTLGPGTYTSTTIGRPDLFQPICVGANDTEVSFEFTAPSAGTYTFDTDGSGYDTVLYALDACGGIQLDCNDDTADLGLLSRISLSLAANQTVIIVVDGYNDSGSVVLNIQ